MSLSIRVIMRIRGNRDPLRSELVHVTHLDLLPRDDSGSDRTDAPLVFPAGGLR